ncbi:MAG: nitroreductase family protein, partial [Prevotellaceae bacterium]|nr:nitroreductase family protein [Prevotellaceae bacterium]
MTLREILEHRRAVRKYDSQQKLDDERVRECLRLATLAPTSSNLQLWEAWHVTSEDTLKALATACLGQGSARSAQQIVVFVTRQDKYRKHAREVLKANINEVNMN